MAMTELEHPAASIYLPLEATAERCGLCGWRSLYSTWLQNLASYISWPLFLKQFRMAHLHFISVFVKVIRAAKRQCRSLKDAGHSKEEMQVGK